MAIYGNAYSLVAPKMRLTIDALKLESPSSGWHKYISDDDVVFAAMTAARWRLCLNSVYFETGKNFVLDIFISSF